MTKLPIILLFFGFSFATDPNEALKLVQQGFDEYLETQIWPDYLDAALAKFQLTHFFRKTETLGNAASTALTSDVVCNLCSIVANFLANERKLGMSDTGIKGEAQTLCELFDIETSRVCEGAIDLNVGIFLYILDNNPDLNPAKFCDIMLQDNGCNFTNIEWSVDIPEGQSPAKDFHADSASTFKILQITDMHVDELYTPSKMKVCSEPLCCQSDQEDGTEGNSCGFWAEYGNDVSENLVDEVIRFANTFDFDYVYFTGDIISHRIWSTTQENNADIIDKFLKKLKSGFTVPVYPVLGNHESSPLNQFVSGDEIPANISTQWLFSLIEEEWAEWLPETALETIKLGGFYTVSPRNGFRIVVLNSNVAYRACWWLLQDDVDPFGQLKWLAQVLEEAEAQGETVHILGHIPTGSVDVMKVWSREYNRIISRFGNTVTGQFTGHVHVDTFQVHYNVSNPDEAVNVAWNGASIVPYDQANPSFKLYHVDQDTFNLVDIDQYTFNLTQANQNSEKSPEWYKIYSFKQDFNVPSLHPKDIGNMLVSMATNHTQIGEYHLYRYKYSDPAVASGCNEDCQKKYLCELSTAVYGETEKCDYLKQLYDDSL